MASSTGKSTKKSTPPAIPPSVPKRTPAVRKSTDNAKTPEPEPVAKPEAAAAPEPAPAAGVSQSAEAAAKASTGPRRARLSVSKIHPWSVLKFSFLLSFAIGIVIIVSTALVWYILNGMNVFTSINTLLNEIAGDETMFNVLQYVEFGKVMSVATLVALIDVVLLTVLSTLFALLYNLTASLVGGVTVTLTDE